MRGCILERSSHTPYAVPAVGDGSCATRHACRRTGYEAMLWAGLLTVEAVRKMP